MRYYFTSIRLAIIKKSTPPLKKNCWRGCGAKGTLLHCWCRCKLLDGMEMPIKARNKTSIWPNNTPSRHIPWVNQKWEKAMAPHSSTLAWKIPWLEEPGGLQYMGSQRVGDDWTTSLSLFTFMHWRRKWQPTPVFLPGESQGQKSLVGCPLWGRPELDTTEAT